MFRQGRIIGAVTLAAMVGMGCEEPTQGQLPIPPTTTSSGENATSHDITVAEEIFPKGIIDRDFFTRDNLRKILRASEGFVQIPITDPLYFKGEWLELDQSKIASVPGEAMNRFKMQGVALIKDEETGNVGVGLGFSENVFLNPDYNNGSYQGVPRAFIVSFNPKDGKVFTAALVETFAIGGDGKNSLSTIGFLFPLPYKDAVNTEVLLILNGRFFQDSPDVGSLLPFRIRPLPQVTAGDKL